MNKRGIDRRGISPVIGVVLLAAIVVVLSSGAAYFIFSLSEEREPQPEVVLEMEVDEDGISHYIEHEQGETLDGDKVTLRGAANPEALQDTELVASNEIALTPVDSEIQVVYTGEHGTTYLLKTFEVDLTFPEPDEGCDWVDAESNGGVDDIKVDGLVVNCDLKTDKVVEVWNGSVIIGHVESDNNVLDADDVMVYGNVDVNGTANLQDGEVWGSVTSQTEDVKIDNGTVRGSVDAAKVVEVIDGSSVDGGLTSDDKTVKVLDSTVSGSIVTEGEVKLQDATIEGDVYAADFDCTSSTINGKDCGSYSPKDPDDA